MSPVRKGGGVKDWLWKGATETSASLGFEFANFFSRRYPKNAISYSLDFTIVNNRFEITGEKLENTKPSPGNTKPYLYYSHDRRSTIINVKQEQRHLQREDIDPESSIFAQRKDPDTYPEITHLGKVLETINIYRDWHFGVDSVLRQS